MAIKKGAATKVVSKKNVKNTSVKKVAKKEIAQKSTSKSKVAPKKAATKAAPKKAVAKAAPKKAVAKAAPKKAVAKVAPKKAVAKAASKKVAPKKAAPKKAVVKVASKKVAAKVAPKKAAPKKAAPKKAVVKVAPKKVVKELVSTKSKKMLGIKEVKEEKIKQTKVVKKAVPTRTVIKSSSSLPQKSDVFKTNTFGTTTLRNDTGKVIAYRKTEDMKRKKEMDSSIKKYVTEEKRSLLDNTIDMTPMYRYSDEELNEFKEIILRKLEAAKTELQYLQSVISRKDESGTEDTENKYQSVEDGSMSMDREQFTQLASRQISFITHLEQALVRIENKTYGICRETGKLIDKARLRAVPHATLSIEAKNAKKS